MSAPRTPSPNVHHPSPLMCDPQICVSEALHAHTSHMSSYSAHARPGCCSFSQQAASPSHQTTKKPGVTHPLLTPILHLVSTTLSEADATTPNTFNSVPPIPVHHHPVYVWAPLLFTQISPGASPLPSCLISWTRIPSAAAGKVVFLTCNSEWGPLQNLTTAYGTGELSTALRVWPVSHLPTQGRPPYSADPNHPEMPGALLSLRLCPAPSSAYGAFSLLSRAQFSSPCRTTTTVHSLLWFSKHKSVTSP